MNKITAFALVIIFCYAECKSILPFLDYYFNYDYITEVLCINRNQPISTCNGKCYLAKKLKQSQETSKPEKSVPKAELEKTPMLSSGYVIKINTHYNLDPNWKNIGYLAKSMKQVFISPPTPPPKV